MSAFKSEREADAFALRAKHREWDDSDIEAVWEEARTSLVRDGRYPLDDDRITEWCVRLLEERS